MDVEIWERRVELPLAAAAVVFLTAYAWPILQPDLSAGWQSACRATTWIVWLAFAADYCFRLVFASDKRRFMRGNIVDLVVIALPLLRPLRLLRLIALLRIVNRGATWSLRGRVAVYVTGAVSLIVLVASLAVLDAERGKSGANIQTFGAAAWWSATTVTTVGYGDRFPVTAEGRFVAVGLMLCGIALVGIVTASLASWLIERIRVTEQETRHDVSELAREIRLLRAQVELLSIGRDGAQD